MIDLGIDINSYNGYGTYVPVDITKVIPSVGTWEDSNLYLKSIEKDENGKVTDVYFVLINEYLDENYNEEGTIYNLDFDENDYLHLNTHFTNGGGVYISILISDFEKVTNLVIKNYEYHYDIHLSIQNSLTNESIEKVPYCLKKWYNISEPFSLLNFKNDIISYYSPHINKFFIGNEPYGYCKNIGDSIDVMTLPGSKLTFATADDGLFVLLYIPLLSINYIITNYPFDKVETRDWFGTFQTYSYFSLNEYLFKIIGLNMKLYNSVITQTSCNYVGLFLTNQIENYKWFFQECEFENEINLTKNDYYLTINRNYLIAYEPIDYNAIDLGLPSGTKWFDKNIGATSPEGYGLYFQWGDTQGYTADQVGTGEGQKEFNYYYGDYKYSKGINEEGFGIMTKYNKTDGKIVLEPEDDIVMITLGSINTGLCTMPTKEDFEELLEYTTNKWVTNYNSTNVRGRFFTSKVNGNSIFIPAAGCAYDGSVHSVSYAGNLWSNSLSDVAAFESNCAVSMSFDDSTVEIDNNHSRYVGFSVRGVIKK